MALFQVSSTPGSAHKLQWLVVLQPTDIQVVPTSVVSPMHNFLLQGRQLGAHMGVAMRQLGPPEDMLIHAANQCFWQVEKSELEKLAAFLRVFLPTPPSVFTLAGNLLQKILGPIKPEALDAILALRSRPKDGLSPSDLPAEAVEDLCSKQDQQDVQQWFAQEQKAREAQGTWQEDHTNWRKAHLPAIAGGGSGAGGVKRKPTRLPKQLNLELCRALAPPGGQLYESSLDNRVRAFYPGDGCRPTTSASLQEYGPHKALLWCLQWLWSQHCENPANGPCPVQGLLEYSWD